MKTIKLSGETYTVRRDIAKLGFIFSYEENGYIGNCNTMTEALSNKLKSINIDFEEIPFIEINESYIVRQKNLRAERRADRYETRAENLEKKAHATDISQQEKNFLSLAEPIKIGHHSEKRHRKIVEKAWNTMGKRVELFEKAEENEGKADYWRNKKYLTTEEKENKKARIEELKQKARDLWIADHKAGGMYDYHHRQFVIAKINKKTVTIDSGSKWEIEYAKDFPQYLQQAKESYFSE